MPDGAVLLGPNREILWFNRTAGQCSRYAASWITAGASTTWCATRVRRVPRQARSDGAAAYPPAEARDRWLLFRL